MHLLHVKETPSNRTMTMETEMSFFKIDAVIISKNTEVASNIDIYAKMKFETSRQLWLSVNNYNNSRIHPAA